MPEKTRKTREERIQEILEVGKALLLEKGFSLTAREIAEKIGVSETYIYTFYPNKKAIMEAIYLEHFQSISVLIRLGEADQDYRERLVRYFMHFYRSSEQTRTLELLYLYALEKSENRPGLELFQQVVPNLTRPLEEFLISGNEKGYFTIEDPVLVADFMHSAFFHMIYHDTIFLKRHLTDEELHRKIGQYVNLCLYGIIKGKLEGK
ncbi:MAG TPA: TetR/AcrR family transcriptional regulator [Bacillota bacterium]|jgi:AcrR family transcriptional regulator|nr:TetR/AcrR family transcriptional regulator [Bacillota bacterium]